MKAGMTRDSVLPPSTPWSCTKVTVVATATLPFRPGRPENSHCKCSITKRESSASEGSSTHCWGRDSIKYPRPRVTRIAGVEAKFVIAML